MQKGRRGADSRSTDLRSLSHPLLLTFSFFPSLPNPSPTHLLLFPSPTHPTPHPPPGGTLFVGNLDFNVDKLKLAGAIEKRIGYGLLASVRLSTDQDSGRSRGFAHIDFYTAESAQKALAALQGLAVEGREIRIDMKKRVSEREKIEPREWGDSSARGIRRAWDGEGGLSKPEMAARPPKMQNAAWCTVYAGNLAYKVTDESLRHTIEGRLSDGAGTVADVRIAEDQDTGRKKGFAWVDFVDAESAERACKELQVGCGGVGV